MCAPESFSEYLAYEILHRPDSWQGFLYIYIYIFFIFHFPDSRLSVLKGFLFYFWWLDSENHQLFPAWNGQLTLTFSFIVLEFEKLLYSPDLKMVLIFLVEKVLQKNEFMFHCHMWDALSRNDHRQGYVLAYMCAAKSRECPPLPRWHWRKLMAEFLKRCGRCVLK